MKFIFLFCSRVKTLLLISFASFVTISYSGDSKAQNNLELILDSIVVSESQKIAQQTPIDAYNGAVYIANIEPGEAGDIDGIELNTVVRKGFRSSAGLWKWEEKIVDKYTLHDPWHTPPSIGVDENGYIHVAYNMHNFPWQYSVSKSSEQIDRFIFRGDKMSLSEKKMAKFENKTPFKDMGYADIPGNQITYPAFYTDNEGVLYVTYRFAAKPAQSFTQRTMSSGIARYNSKKEKWQSIGGALQLKKSDYETSFFKKETIPNALASQTGWTSYHPRLAFGPDQRMNVHWFWREGVAGETLQRPCFLYSNDLNNFFEYDGNRQVLPARSSDCSNINIDNSTTFNTLGSFAVNSKGVPYLLISPTDGERLIYTLQQGDWIHETSPNKATELFIDANDELWAISSGINVYKKDSNTNSWLEIHSTPQREACYAKVALSELKDIAYIYTQSCNTENTVSVYKLNLLN